MLPHPKTIEFTSGKLHARTDVKSTIGVQSTRLRDAVSRSKLDGYDLAFEIQDPSGKYPEVDSDYHYSVRVDGNGVRIDAKSVWGALAACSTLLQMNRDGFLPCCHIDDYPTYPWRGLMIDVSRHFMSIDILKRNIDLMAYFRMNVLHLHLSDDQAFRFPSSSYPNLSSEQHYSITELRDLIDYAADRAIRVIPEIDVLGHTHSWLVGHPEWGLERVTERTRRFGVHSACLDPSKSFVVDAVKTVFNEVADCFPDHFLHMGGDEVNPTSWIADERFKRWMSEQGHSDARAIETAFNIELVRTIERLGKRAIGWDEVLHDDLPRQTTVQFWRGMRHIDKVIESGFDVIVSSPYYLDLHYPAHIHHLYHPNMSGSEQEAAQQTTLRDHRLAHVRDGVATHLNFGLVEQLQTQTSGKIVGGEACMWSELVSEKQLLQRIWSRLPVISNRFWNGGGGFDIDSIYKEADNCYEHLETLGYSDLRTVVLNQSENPLKPLLSMLEPVKWYGRLLGSERLRLRSEGGDETGLSRPYDTDTPLNRWIDRIPPESLATRDFSAAYERDEDVSRWTTAWREQLEHCESAKVVDDSINELIPASRALAKLADMVDGAALLETNMSGPFGEYVLPVADEILQIRLKQVLSNWNLTGDVTEIKRGHINDTFSVADKWVLQRVNPRVFNQPSNLLRNYRLVEPVVHDLVPRLVCSMDGDDFVETGDGSIWRIFEYIESRNFDNLPDDLCEIAGATFGKFLKRLKSLSVQLEPNIEGFHQFDKYLDDLDAIRVDGVADEELDFVERRRNDSVDFSEARQIIHGDCKVNNLLFHSLQDVVLAIVDLDTLMWGHPAWDYGDLIRSIVTGGELNHESDTRIDAVTQGFLKEYPVVAEQRQTFARAPAHMSLMLGTRFLADHFAGDEYFKVDYHGENLERAREQFRLTQVFENLADNLLSVLR